MPPLYPDPVPPGPNAKPTPTQAEIDAARNGNNVMNKVADGSPPDPYENYWSSGDPGQTKPIPVLDSIAPTSGTAGTVALVASGQYISDDTKIIFAGVVQASTVNGAKTQVSATITGVTAGAKIVKLRNSSGDSNSKTFTATP
jgi:hypothetical protein